MIGNLFTVADPEPAVLRAALAGLLAVPEGAVDVADADGDQEGRDWEAPVLCTCRRLPPGDLSLELDVTVEDRIAGQLTEGALAQRLAVSTGGSVLYPSEIELPSAYWVAVPDGGSVRCRLEPVDHGEDTGYRVEAVEEPVEDLPGAKVEILPEVMDRQHIDTPVADAFLSGYPTGTTATVEGHVHYALRVWERLARRLESDWLPSGRYRDDLFRRDLEARDDLANAVAGMNEPYAEGLRAAVARLDAVFSEHTEAEADSDVGDGADGWWWHRRPRSIPW
ncbi:hypothetical protein [Streptomyces sp. NPDC004065]|uniref:hypothetical protein n=1 Tax=Streptomyces sp. NPDC004065 TaxID=3364689 RepID=UPI00384C57B3